MFRTTKQYTEREQQLIQKLKALSKDYPQSELDLSSYKEVLTDELLEPILRNANQHLKRLTIDYCSKLTEKTPRLIGKHCYDISYLSTKHLPWKEWSTFGWYLTPIFRRLTELHLDGCVNLSYIYILAPKLEKERLGNIAKAFRDINKGKLIHFQTYWQINDEYFGVREILDIIKADKADVSKKVAGDSKKVKNNCQDSSLEVKHASLVPLSLFSEQKQTMQTTALLPLTDLSSIIPEGTSADLALKLMIAYCNNLTQHVKVVERHLGLDEETQREKNIIKSNRQLNEYYEKLCELTYYFHACQSISTMLVAKQEDLQDMATSLAAATGKAVLDFIPVISGLSCIITGLETVEHGRHDVEKHRFAIKLLNFTHGLGIQNIDRLIECFARKLTIMNQQLIANSEILVSRISLISKVMQKVREFREGQDYTDEQKLALADLIKILDAITNDKISPPIRGTEEERFNQLLAIMLKFMQQEQVIVLKLDTVATPPRYSYGC